MSDKIILPDFMDQLDKELYNKNTFMLTGEIDGYTAARLSRMFTLKSCDSSADREISFIISSNGGELQAGLAIQRSMLALQHKGWTIVGEVRGMAASMACMLLQVCDIRLATELDRLMIHGISSGGREREDMEAYQTEWKYITSISSEWAEFLARRNTAKPKSKYRTLPFWKKQLMSKTPLYLTGKESLECGLIDGLI